MAFRIFAVLTIAPNIAALLAGCSTTPTLDVSTPGSTHFLAANEPENLTSKTAISTGHIVDSPTLAEETVTVGSIVDEISCEIYTAAVDEAKEILPYNKLVPPIEQWTASVDLTLQVDNNVNLTPSLTYIDPVKVLGFSFGGSGQYQNSNERIFTQSFTIDINALSKNNPSPCERERAHDFDLEGNLGIGDVMHMGMRSLNRIESGIVYKVQQTSPATPQLGGATPKQSGGVSAASKSQDGFGETTQFVILKNISATGPLWTISTFKGPGGLFGASHTDTHKLAISFVPPSPSGKSMQNGAPKDGGAGQYGHDLNAARDLGTLATQLRALSP